MSKIKKVMCGMVSICIASMMFQHILGAVFMYPVTARNGSTAQSSISTMAQPEFAFQSAAQVLMEPQTGKILYANNENERLLPASVTKIMTLLLLMEQIDAGKIAYTDKVTCSAKASQMGGSQIWFKEGEQLSIDEALKAICVVSANDVTMAVAEMIGGSEENFVKMMNEKAATLGMENTHFMNPHGIDEDDHYTTAKDIAIMSRELITKHPDILKYTSIWMDTLRDGTFALTNTNNLIRFYEGANGLKTGSTSKALFNLSSTATRNGSTFIAVVMKAPSSAVRAEECKQLLNFAFSNYETKDIYSAGVVVDHKMINKNIDKEAEIVVKNGISSLVDKGSKLETTESITYDDTLFTAPVAKEQTVGKIEVFNKANNEKIGESELIVKEDIPKSEFMDYWKKIMNLYVLNHTLS